MKKTTFYRIRSWETIGGSEFASDSAIQWKDLNTAIMVAKKWADRELPDGGDARRHAVIRVTEETVMECGRFALDSGDELNRLNGIIDELIGGYTHAGEVRYDIERGKWWLANERPRVDYDTLKDAVYSLVGIDEEGDVD